MKSAEKSHLFNVAHKLGIFECVVCGKKLSLHDGVNIFTDLTKSQRRNSVCSDSCMSLYWKAINYVKNLYGLTNRDDARQIVIAKWFDRGAKQHEKDIRIQARNVQGNAAA